MLWKSIFMCLVFIFFCFIQQEAEISSYQAVRFMWPFFFFKSNVERLCRSVEDQFNEIKAKDDQQTQLIHDLNMQKARLQTQNGEHSEAPGTGGPEGSMASDAHGPLFGRGAEPSGGREGVSDFTVNQKQTGSQPATGGG